MLNREVKTIYVPDSMVRMARRRTTPMIRQWAVRGIDSFADLVIAAYVQGVTDGIEAMEKQKEKKTLEDNLMKEQQEIGLEEKTERTKHLDFCKKRAADYIAMGDTTQAFSSFMSDMQNYPELANHPHLMDFAGLFFQDHFKTPEQLGKYIEDFN